MLPSEYAAPAPSAPPASGLVKLILVQTGTNKMGVIKALRAMVKILPQEETHPIAYTLPHDPQKSAVAGGAPIQAQGGCYVAMAVYGSYNCPEVLVLRRYRDDVLTISWYGRVFIRMYYAVNPSCSPIIQAHSLVQPFFQA